MRLKFRILDVLQLKELHFGSFHFSPENVFVHLLARSRTHKDDLAPDTFVKVSLSRATKVIKVKPTMLKKVWWWIRLSHFHNSTLSQSHRTFILLLSYFHTCRWRRAAWWGAALAPSTANLFTSSFRCWPLIVLALILTVLIPVLEILVLVLTVQPVFSLQAAGAHVTDVTDTGCYWRYWRLIIHALILTVLTLVLKILTLVLTVQPVVLL